MPVNKTNEMILKDLTARTKCNKKLKNVYFVFVSRTSVFRFHKNFQIYFNNIKWFHGVVVITSPQLHSSMAELRFKSQIAARLTREDL